MSGAGEGEVVSKKVGKEVRGARMSGQELLSYNATSVDVEIDPYCRRLQKLAAARPTFKLLFRRLSRLAGLRVAGEPPGRGRREFQRVPSP